VSGKKTVAVGVGAGLTLLAIMLVLRFVTANPNTLRGAVVSYDPDPAKELPVADVEVSIVGGVPPQTVRTDSSGYFNIRLGRRIRLAAPITLRFRHPDYQPLVSHDFAGSQLYVAHLVPRVQAPEPAVSEIKVANVVAQYSVNTANAMNIGSAVKTFQIVNTGNVPCKGRRPCSPDGLWRAASGSVVLDAGPGNEFHNARASCIAGPCPFTRIEDQGIGRNTEMLKISALDWSDTATFLVEAEVFKPVVSDVLRKSYPVIFGQALTFTLPGSAQSVSIVADINGTAVVFPLGPKLILSWARCQLSVNPDQTKVYRCELKPGYRFS
jgi:hypothetical protein